MAGKNNMIPLHKTTHWRHLRRLIKETEMHLFGKRLSSDKDLEHIVCYRCSGINLQGKNVYRANGYNRSCFVADNQYEVYEFQNGIFMAHDIDYDYWLYGYIKVEYEYKNGKSYQKVMCFASWDGSIIWDGSKYHFHEFKSIYSTQRGEMSRDVYFDSEGARASAYGYSFTTYLGGFDKKTHPIVDKSAVKIYKKNKKKGRK